MPRRAREESKTGYYHIMIRGINKEKIFETDKEKEKILNLIREKTNEEVCRIAAYCIMDNHLHIIIIAEKPALVRIMKKINISFAMSYNQRHKRIGPVFQDRFKSENIIDEYYFYGAIRYIHNNPVKAKIVSKAEEYKWSSIREYYSNDHFLIDIDTKKEIEKGFLSEDDFFRFHQGEDDTCYLEIKEEANDIKYMRAKRIVEEFRDEKGDNVNTEKLVIKLLEDTSLSYRKIGELVGVSVKTIYAVNKKYCL